MSLRLFPANKRGHANHGWLNTYHSFSFANFYDPDLMGFGALRVVNDDTIAPGTGFPEHSHSDMEIITIPLAGAVKHRDSSGGEGVVSTGEVQIMSAGTGVVHSEFNASKDEPLSLFQIWIEPSEYHIPPRYAEKKIDQKKTPGKIQRLVTTDGEEGSLIIKQHAYLSQVELKQDESFSYTLHGKNQGVFIMVVEGSINIGETLLGKRDAVGVSEEGDIELKALEDSTVLLFIEVPMVG